MIVEGELAELLKIVAEEATLRLNAKAAAIVQDFEIQCFAGGSGSAVQGMIGTYTTSLAEIGYLG